MRSGIDGFLTDDMSAVTVLSVTLNMSSTVYTNHRYTMTGYGPLAEMDNILTFIQLCILLVETDNIHVFALIQSETMLAFNTCVTIFVQTPTTASS